MKFLVAYTAREKKVDGFFKQLLASREVELVSNHHLKIYGKFGNSWNKIYTTKDYRPKNISNPGWKNKLQTSESTHPQNLILQKKKRNICKHWKLTRIFLIKQVHPPKTNQQIAPENRPFDPKGNDRIPTYSNHPFSDAKMLVSGRVRFLNSFPCCLYGFRAGIS